MVASRAAQEYKIDVVFEPTVFESARWVETRSDKDLRTIMDANPSNIVLDRDEHPVFLAKSGWELDYMK